MLISKSEFLKRLKKVQKELKFLQVAGSPYINRKDNLRCFEFYTDIPAIRKRIKNNYKESE